jgi:uncharacterized membrane protein YccC
MTTELQAAMDNLTFIIVGFRLDKIDPVRESLALIKQALEDYERLKADFEYKNEQLGAALIRAETVVSRDALEWLEEQIIGGKIGHDGLVRWLRKLGVEVEK